MFIYIIIRNTLVIWATFYSMCACALYFEKSNILSFGEGQGIITLEYHKNEVEDLSPCWITKFFPWPNWKCLQTKNLLRLELFADDHVFQKIE